MGNKFADAFGIEEDEEELPYNEHNYVFRAIPDKSIVTVTARGQMDAWNKLKESDIEHEWKYYVLLGTDSYIAISDRDRVWQTSAGL